MFYSDAKQDQFAANILEFKQNGYYLDIGSCNSIVSNNTFFFQNLNWKGICVEIESSYNESYSTRKDCIYLNSDATKLNYKELFLENNFPSIIDYLSLDIDTLSLTVLKNLPFADYKFRVITIEHDAYLYGDKYRKQQREILTDNGYELICSNVYVQQPGFNKPECAFEDWWVYPSEFSRNLLDTVKSESEYPSNIIAKF
jgi:hypothetical protein